MEYNVQEVCEVMGISRAGYYKWKARGKSTRAINREKLLEAVSNVNKAHPSHGYRWVAAYLRINMQYTICDNMVYKCFKYLGLSAATKHRYKSSPRKIRDAYPNLIYSTWECVDRPRQVIVSDMTVLKCWIITVEVTFYFDVFTKEMLTHRCAERRGDRKQYIEGLEDVKLLLKGQTEPVYLHTDQGSVYSSIAYNELIKDTVIIRSMSRAGKPTDNPVNEALNGWIKEELYTDFKIVRCKQMSEIMDCLDQYQIYYNERRPCYAIGYDTPVNYRKRFYKGEIPKKETFCDRELSEIPKFVRARKDEIDNQ
jgi:transposase InsO family protein